MHIITPYETAVSLFARDGGVRTYASRREALRELGASFIRNCVAEHFWEFAGYTWSWRDGDLVCGERQYNTASYIMRDDTGAPLTWADFAGLVAKRRRLGRYASFWNGGGPVPHRGRWHHTRRCRRPQTCNELRQAIPVQDEGEVAPRSSRNLTHLPNSWDDYMRATDRDRNWKRHRKHQWKGD